MKRIIDFSLSLILIIVLSPAFIFTYIFVLSFIGKPTIFKQRRPGLSGEIFELYKFRSMNNNVDETGALLPNEVRLTSAGKFIRATSLDELPQLINVLKGDMSLIGPRPLLVDYMELYSEEQARRHDVRPGMTGWAQVNGRNAISWKEKFEYDVWYVDNRSLLLDIKILFKTFGKVIRSKDVNKSKDKIVTRFTGN